MSIFTISQIETRNAIISAQKLGLDDHDPLTIIRQLGYIQIDTLSVAERAHHHVIQTRSSSYSKSDIDDMMTQKQIFEYWSHAASYLPMDDYRFTLLRKKEYAKGQSHWFEQNKKLNKYVLDRIKAEGPLQSKDFKETRDHPSAWYDWKPAKIALEQLFMEGKLMVVGRRNFQKIYDVTERVLPHDVDTRMPSVREYCKYLIRTTLKAQAIASISEIGYLRKGIRAELIKTIDHLVRSKEIVRVKVEGLGEEYYNLNAEQCYETPTEVHILSPFDNLVIQRKRLTTLFNYDYQIECYVPEAKRKYGYYSLPVLYGNRFVARFDPKADRKTRVFTLKSIWFETDFIPNDDFYIKFSQKLKQFAEFCECDRVVVDKCVPDSNKRGLDKAIN